MTSISRYFRFTLVVIVGELLLASTFIFTKTERAPLEHWLLMGRLLLMLLLLYGLNYTLHYGQNPVRAYLSRYPPWQHRLWRLGATLVVSLPLIPLLHWGHQYLLGQPWSPALSILKAEFIYFVPMVLQVTLMHTLFDLNERGHLMALHNEALQRDRSEARFEALKQQLSPHFLFNSFATLNWLIRDDPTAAERFVHKMSQVYRYVLHQGEQKCVTLGEEMAFVESYLFLLDMRFGPSLRVEIAIPPELHTWRLPPLAIQIVVENAVKHNIVSQEQPLFITLSAEAGALTVRNNLQPRLSPELASGVGIKNLNARFHFLGRAGLEVQPAEGYFTVMLPLFA